MLKYNNDNNNNTELFFEDRKMRDEQKKGEKQIERKRKGMIIDLSKEI